MRLLAQESEHRNFGYSVGLAALWYVLLACVGRVLVQLGACGDVRRRFSLLDGILCSHAPCLRIPAIGCGG